MSEALSVAPPEAMQSQPASPEAIEEATTVVASALHENWRKTRINEKDQYEPRIKETTDSAWIEARGTNQVDIANTEYTGLPEDWQAENKAAAGLVADVIHEAGGRVDLNDEATRVSVGNTIHTAWLERNGWAKGGELDVPFEQLPADEQAKDIEQLEIGMQVLAPESGNVQNRINFEEKFKVHRTAELIGELSEGLVGLGEQEAKRVHKAINLALELHIDQSDRPSGEPYVNHVLSVGKRLVVEYGVTDPDLIIAAALHDSVEDQSSKLASLGGEKNGTERERAYKFISSQYGERVAEIIHSLSNEEVPEGLDAETKNKIYLDHVTEAVQDPDVCLIKLADFSENALTLENIADSERRLKLIKKYAPVVEMFIDRLQDGDIQMGDQQKNELIVELKSVHDERGAPGVVDFLA